MLLILIILYNNLFFQNLDINITNELISFERRNEFPEVSLFYNQKTKISEPFRYSTSGNSYQFQLVLDKGDFWDYFKELNKKMIIQGWEIIYDDKKLVTFYRRSCTYSECIPYNSLTYDFIAVKYNSDDSKLHIKGFLGRNFDYLTK